MKRAQFLIGSALLLAGCASPRFAVGEGSSLPAGLWAAPGIAMSVDAAGGRIDWPCATASFAGPLRLDVGGHYLTSGRVQRIGSAAEPANISGRLDAAGRLWVDVAVPSGLVVQSKRLRPVRRTAVPPCR